jgi:transcription termination/antitermination protein NusA
MLVALGEKNIKTVEDVADCATDDLLGWNERKDKETIRHGGILDAFNLSKQEVEDVILAARVKAGWISEADLAPEAEEIEEAEETEGETGEGEEQDETKDGGAAS